MSTKALQDVLYQRELVYRELLGNLLDRVENDPEEYGWWQLREALELVSCLRRLLGGRSVADVHKAFGAPGDFGYETPIGAALAKLYSPPAICQTCNNERRVWLCPCGWAARHIEAEESCPYCGCMDSIKRQHCPDCGDAS